MINDSGFSQTQKIRDVTFSVVISGYLKTVTRLTPRLQLHVGGAVASWLMASIPDRVVRVRALAGDIVLCYWARHLTLTVPLSTQVGTGKFNAGGNPAMD